MDHKALTIIDLSRTLETDMPQSAALPRFEIAPYMAKAAGARVNCNILSLAEHMGTHCDAPFHIFSDGQSIDQLTVDAFVGNGVVLNFTHMTGKSVISAVDLERQEKVQNIQLETGDIVLIHTGFDDRHWTAGSRITEKIKDRPTLGLDAAEFMNSRGIKAVGLDTGSPDISGTELPVHQHLLKHQILIIESLTNLDLLPDTGFLFVALPLKIKGGSGSPVRAVAIIFN